jgi:hypothetical protein
MDFSKPIPRSPPLFPRKEMTMLFRKSLFVPAVMLVGALLSAQCASAQSEPPAAPTNLMVEIGLYYEPFYFASAFWTDNSSNESGFVLEWWHHKHGKFVLRGTYTVRPDATHATAGVEVGKNRYRVKAFNAYGDSAWSKWVGKSHPK